MGLDERFGDSEPESGPPARAERDETIEDRVTVGHGNAGPGVGDRHDHFVTAALSAIQRFAASDLFTFDTGDIIHALSGLGVYRADVRSALLTATSCTPYAAVNGSVLVVGGVDLDGEALRVVVIVRAADLFIVRLDRERTY